MKTLYSLFLVLFISSGSLFGQCVTADASVQGPLCFGEGQFIFHGIGTSSCPETDSLGYHWEVLTPDDQIYASENGGSPGQTMIDDYILSWDGFSQPFNHVCLTVTAYEGDTELGSTEYCFNVNYPLPIDVVATIAGSSWCQETCVVATVVNSTWPVTFEWGDGSAMFGNGYHCYVVPGFYTITAADQNGCFASTQIYIPEMGIENNSCETATVLSSGIIESDTLCSMENQSPSCSGLQYYMSGWYVINSGDNTHINVGLQQLYYNTPANQNFNVEVYEEVDGQGCSGQSLVYCHTGNSSSSCFDLADEITVQPNTNYYFHVAAQWTTSIPISIIAVLSEEAIDPICGCTNPLSCNYSPTAYLNDFTCDLHGCTDAGACNYSISATCDDGTCIFGNAFNGQIYHDVNGDGIWQTAIGGEPTLGSIGVLTIVELGITIYPDADGAFVVPDLIPGVYTLTFEDVNGTWMVSPDVDLQLTLPTCNGLNLGLVPASGATAQINGSNYTWWSNIFCNQGFSPGIWIQNTGNVHLSGTYTMSFDPLLVPNVLTYNEPYNTYDGSGTLTWDIDLLPGEYAYYGCHILGPGTGYVGQSFTFSHQTQLMGDDEVVFYDETWTSTHIVTCSYDPNDKSAAPEGYSDQHFILAGDEIEYRIRFQNTGNAYAHDVMIEDEIDIAHLDISTFTPVVASHSYSTLVHDDGTVQFVFNNIQLPDSFSNEAGSHGFVVYRIKTLSGIEAGSVINNTAEIYFDDNPAVITNTTYHTIYDCAWIQPLPVEESTCAGVTYSIGLDDPYVETYDWYVDGVYYSSGSQFDYSSDNAGDIDLSLHRTNPLCTVESEMILHNRPLPGTDILENGNILTAPAGASWEWFLNDQSMGISTQEIMAVEAGIYSVNTINEFGCIMSSEEVVITSINELAGNIVYVFPNPSDKEVCVKLSPGRNSLTLFNALGEKAGSWSNVYNSMIIKRETLSAGSYMLVVTNEKGETGSVKLVIR